MEVEFRGQQQPVIIDLIEDEEGIVNTIPKPLNQKDRNGLGTGVCKPQELVIIDLTQDEDHVVNTNSKPPYQDDRGGLEVGIRISQRLAVIAPTQNKHHVVNSIALRYTLRQKRKMERREKKRIEIESRRQHRLKKRKLSEKGKCKDVWHDPDILGEGFPGKVIIDYTRDSAFAFALQEYTENQSVERGRRMVLWSDGSSTKTLQFQGSGFGVAYKQSEGDTEKDWIGRSWQMQQTADSEVAELLGISMALVIARDACYRLQETQRPNIVVVYSDCQTALKWFQEWRPAKQKILDPLNKELFRKGAIATSVLERKLNIRVEVRWVPGHEGVKGNEMADRAARVGMKGL